MRVKKRPFHFFLLAIVLGILLGYLVSTYSPSYLIQTGFLSIPMYLPVILLLLGILFSICTYLFNSTIQGLLFALFAGLYFLLKVLGLNNLFFLALFLALFVTAEVFFLKKK